MKKDPLRRTAKSSTLDRKGNIVLKPNGTPLLGSRSVAWGTSPAFGESVLRGTNLTRQSILWSTHTLGGQSILWGTNAANASSILRGTSVLWGTASMGQDSTSQGRLF